MSFSRQATSFRTIWRSSSISHPATEVSPMFSKLVRICSQSENAEVRFPGSKIRNFRFSKSSWVFLDPFNWCGNRNWGGTWKDQGRNGFSHNLPINNKRWKRVNSNNLRHSFYTNIHRRTLSNVLLLYNHGSVGDLNVDGESVSYLYPCSLVNLKVVPQVMPLGHHYIQLIAIDPRGSTSGNKGCNGRTAVMRCQNNCLRLLWPSFA